MKIILAALVSATLVVPAAVHAAPDQRGIAVEIGDLDLDSDKGQHILAMRLHRAARAMCEIPALESLPQSQRKQRQCIRDALTRALAATKGSVQSRIAGRFGAP